MLTTICLLVSGMIGSAIFSLSGLTISYAGPSSIVSWIIAAIIQLFYGLSMAELATIYKKSGGVFVFPESSFEGENGIRLGFISAWGNLMADIVSIAFSSMYIGIYLSASFPNLSKYQIPISIIAIVFCYLLNSMKFSITGKINAVFTALLSIILILISFISFKYAGFNKEYFIPFFSQGIYGNLGFLKSIPIAMIGYSSIMSISFMVSEIDNPKTNVSKAVYIGAGIVTVLYVLVLISIVGSITSKELINADMVYIPLFAVCFSKLTNFPYIKILVSIAAVVALFTTMLVVMAINGRCMKAVAEKKLIPNALTIVGKNDTPIIAMGVLTVISSVLVFFPSIIELLVNLGALFAIMTIVINFLSLLKTRSLKKQSEYKSPLSSKMIIFIIIIFLVCYIPDILNGGYVIWIYTIIWYIIGIAIYKVHRR